MRRAYTFLDRGDVYLCVRTDELGDFERPGHETLSPAEARQRLQTWVHEDNRLVLRELGRVLGLSLSGLVAQDDMRTLARALSERLATDMATHALVRHRTRYRNVGFILEKPVDLADLLPPEEPEEKPVHWVELELVDHDDRPVPNMECDLVFPDGRTRKVRTDAHGRARLADVRPGNYEVQFTRLAGGTISQL